MELQPTLHSLKKIHERLTRQVKLFLGIFLALWKSGVPKRFWLFLFVLGIVLGVSFKYWASEHFTIGYSDYTLLPSDQLYDLNAIQEKILANGGALTQPEGEKQYPAESIDQ